MTTEEIIEHENERPGRYNMRLRIREKDDDGNLVREVVREISDEQIMLFCLSGVPATYPIITLA